MAEERFPILGKGEILTQSISAPKQGGSKTPVRSFETARERLLPQFESLLKQIKDIETSMRLERVFFQVSLDCEYLAKSYYPANLVNCSGWELVGSRPWYQKARDEELLSSAKQARVLFLCADPIRIEDAFSRLERPQLLADREKGDIVKIDSLGLQGSGDRLIGFRSGFKEGVVELVFHPMKGREWKECKRKLSRLFSQPKRSRLFWDWERSGDAQPIFLPALLDVGNIREMGNFNPLRAARPMPSISFPRINKNNVKRTIAPPPSPVLRTVYPEIGVIDGGADTAISYLKGWVSNVEVTPEPEGSDYVEHGTAVCGAILYGPYDFEEEPAEPKLKVKSFRVFPVPKEFGLDLDLYRVLDWLEDIVTNPANRNIHVYVLSFGPRMPVDDYEVNRFTATLDQLAYQHDVLFVVAAGNDGDLNDPLNRIQPPSDMVNGIGVGAYTFKDKGRICPAPYCCIGPGRPGSMIKPDVCSFGGSDDFPFYVLLAGSDGEIAEEQGTSFSAPLVASAAGNILHRASVPDIITPQITKALLIHHARPFSKSDRVKYGWGALSDGPDEVMHCSANEVKVLYNGVIDLTRWVRLRLPFPEDLKYEGQVHFQWTLVYACDVCAAMPDDYTLAGTEIVFRPNQYLFRYSKDQLTAVKVDEMTDPDHVERLLNDGWRKSAHPASLTYKKEQQLREEGKWDTVVRGKKRVHISNVKTPALDVHAIGRGDWDNKGGPGRINYAAVVSIRVSDRKIPLYNLIKAQVPELVPVRLRARARQRVMHQ